MHWYDWVLAFQASYPCMFSPEVASETDNRPPSGQCPQSIRRLLHVVEHQTDTDTRLTPQVVKPCHWTSILIDVMLLLGDGRDNRAVSAPIEAENNPSGIPSTIPKLADSLCTFAYSRIF